MNQTTLNFDASAAEQHVFERSTGIAGPYRFVGWFSFPSKGLAEANIWAYQNALRELYESQKGLGVSGGCCQHCGMVLMHNFVLEGQDGRRFVVGSDCIRRSGEMTSAIKRAAEAASRRAAEDRRRAEEAREYAAFLARIGADGFVSVRQLFQASDEARCRCEQERRERQAREAWATNAWLIEVLAGMAGGFCEDMAARLRTHALDLRNFSQRQIDIMCDIYAKQAGRRGSKAYNGAYDEFYAKAGLE